ncbi:MAG: hypothetical protein ACT4N5_05065 [Nitrosopumilaceae archaeon]
MRQIPQNLLIIIGFIVIAIVIFAVFSVYSTKVPAQRQVIHVFDNPTLKLENPNGLIKISEIQPNSMNWFWYPDPDRFSDRDEFDRFLLIRLSYLEGGGADEVSSFRAYSAIDPSSHCLLRYWPEEGRRMIEDSCSGNMYDPVYGQLVKLGGSPILTSDNLGLPYLGLSSDKEGFLYVEPPIWTEDKNGVIGIGRKIPEVDMKSINETIERKEKEIKSALDGFYLPEEFSTGDKLDSRETYGIQYEAYYLNPASKDPTLTITYEYCNCTISKERLADEEMTKRHSQLLEINKVPIVAYPRGINSLTGNHTKYVFVFYQDELRINFYTNLEFQPGLTLVKELLEKDKHLAQ